jgi:hypothetical protein
MGRFYMLIHLETSQGLLKGEIPIAQGFFGLSYYGHEKLESPPWAAGFGKVGWLA